MGYRLRPVCPMTVAAGIHSFIHSGFYTHCTTALVNFSTPLYRIAIVKKAVKLQRAWLCLQVYLSNEALMQQ